MTVVHLDGFAPYTGKEVLQFSPNFTVYALPSDTLCLYSEDRKFLLHGTLYCAHRGADRRGRKELWRISFACWSNIFRPSKYTKP